MPQHRCLIQLNPALCREETQLMRRDWHPFISGDGYLAPKAILSWFNRGYYGFLCRCRLMSYLNVPRIP
ncbi:hypothetical protein DPMN_148579 [Dreissena polymorpha]|uniref:Uncharacterized protein n=1 Tax=Dreissena polymorpha TaxID=45954 RepID=A0A9D4J402_DREPO|nr:hypothetical protein DPMN_148579 [Dreissena polymorpha]